MGLSLNLSAMQKKFKGPLPDKKGHYGPYGGKYVPETLMAALDQLQPGQGLRLTAPFKPVPLFAVMADKGFAHSERALDAGEWEVLFTPAAMMVAQAALIFPIIAALVRQVDRKNVRVYYDIANPLYRGEDRTITINFATGTNVTGWSLKYTAALEKQGTPTVELSTAAGTLTIVSATQVTGAVSAAVAAALTAQPHFWDIWRMDSGYMTLLGAGQLTVNQPVRIV